MTVEPLRFEDGALFVLDQRALPAEEQWIRCTGPEAVVECIRTLAVRGAPAIGIAAGYAMALAEDPEAAAPLLRDARPTAVNLGWAVDQLLAADDRLERARELHREQERADRRLAALGAERFEPGDRALTHCNAGALATAGVGTAGGVLEAAWQRGCLAHVWVDETRPLLQGARLTAYELSRAGIPFRVVADSSAASLMARGLVDRIVVGADRIAANGDVANKIGPILWPCGGGHDLPFYVARPFPPRPLHRASGLHTHRGAHPARCGRQPAQPAFDVTPAELLSAIFTEAGVSITLRRGESPLSRALNRYCAREMWRLGLVAARRKRERAEGDRSTLRPRLWLLRYAEPIGALDLEARSSRASRAVE